jgi:hypothetical protein
VRSKAYFARACFAHPLLGHDLDRDIHITQAVYFRPFVVDAGRAVQKFRSALSAVARVTAFAGVTTIEAVS